MGYDVEYLKEELEKAFEMSSAYKDSGECLDDYYLEMIVKNCIFNKGNLIKVLSSHPNWDEKNLRIHFDSTYKRLANVSDAVCYLSDAMNTIVKYCDSIYGNERAGALGSVALSIRAYCRHWFCVSDGIPEEAEDYFRNTFERFNPTYGEARIHKGAKCTRAVLKLLRQYGFDSILPADVQHDFMASYSHYADAMNPLEITRHTVLSVNPVDFMLMSYGNSWTSCHDITRGGCYCGGCESYAYDRDTMIFYTVDADTPNDEITFARKINRQLNFFNGDTLVACRVYPQQEGSDIYRECKNIVQTIIAECLGKPNVWRLSDWDQRSEGHQYRDYEHFGPYKGYRLSDILDEERYSWHSFANSYKDTLLSVLHIGSDDAICPVTGDPIDSEGSPINLPRGKCDICGEYCSLDDLREVNGTMYCSYCYDNNVSCCYWCDEDFDYDDLTYIESEDVYVCSDCLDEHYRHCTICCEYHGVDEVTEMKDGEYVCDECLENYYSLCDECGEWVRSDELLCVDGRYYCRECLDTKIADGDVKKCPECGEYFFVDDDNPEQVYCSYCESRLVPCDLCGELHVAGFNYHFQYVDGKRVCTSCAYESVGICTECAEVHLKENLTEDGKCKKCKDNSRR